MYGHVMRRRALGYVNLPWQLSVSSDALGRTLRARVAGHDMTLRMPRAPEAVHRPLLAPEYPWKRAPVVPFLHESWGFWNAQSQVSIERLGIDLLVEPRLDVQGPDALSTVASALRDDWLPIFRAWIDLRAGRMSNPGQSSGVVITAKVGTETRATGVTMSVAFWSHCPNWVDLVDAAGRANDGQDLPVAHALLLLASGAQDARRSVIDAASACEVALGERIRAILAATELPESAVPCASGWGETPPLSSFPCTG